MSRIGKLPITVPSGVDVNIDGRTVDGQGPQGHPVAHRRRADHRRARRRRHPRGQASERRASQPRAARPVPHPGAQHGRRRDPGLREEDGDPRRRLPRRAQGLGPGVRARLQPPGQGRAARGHHLRGGDPDPVLRLRASTSSWSARSPPTSASCASPTRTRARACATRARRSAARSERRVSDMAKHDRQRKKRTGARASPSAAVSPARRHFRLRKKVSGTAERPRLVVNRSSRHITVAAHRRPRPATPWRRRPPWRPTSARWTATRRPARPRSASWSPPAPRAAGITAVVFDRGGNDYHGRIAALGRRRPRGRAGVLMMNSTRAR